MADTVGIYADLLTERIAETQGKRNALLRAIDDMRETRSLTAADDEHDPEGSTVSLDQARDTALLERIERTLGELTQAQERLTAGTYGSCERCQDAIPAERLQVRPEARLCVRCVSSQR